MPREHFSAISWQEQVAFWWNDDDDEDVCFVQDQYTKLDNDSASSLKQQSTGSCHDIAEKCSLGIKQ
jgi:hypothetical protein